MEARFNLSVCSRRKRFVVVVVVVFFLMCDKLFFKKIGKLVA